MLEFNIDGLIGPTHHFGGLGVGNLASERNRLRVSNPKQAALEGIAKMRLLAEAGVPQFYLPPPVRPNWKWLRACGFHGSPEDVLKRGYDESPQVLSAAFSSAFMWTANAGTFGAPSDSVDGIGCCKIANLTANIHRVAEGKERFRQLRELFANVASIRIEKGLPSTTPLRDEGAANVMRLSSPSIRDGFYLFVYGEQTGGPGVSLEVTPGTPGETPGSLDASPRCAFARQTSLASSLVAKSLALLPERVQFIQQTQDAIGAGVFHNDVIATSHENFLLVHERAFVAQEKVLEETRFRFEKIAGVPLIVVVVSEEEMSLDEAVRTYLFNSQIVTLPDGTWMMLCPKECANSAAASSALARLQEAAPRLKRIETVSLRESMANGGGPACLRLRGYLAREELAKLPAGARCDARSLERLERLIQREYPESVTLANFANLEFAKHAQEIAGKIEEVWRGL